VRHDINPAACRAATNDPSDNDNVRRRKWLVWTFGIVCALALGLGFLARPEDELAGIRRLRPTTKPYKDPFSELDPGDRVPGTEYDFVSDPSVVKAALPGTWYAGKHPHNTFAFQLPSGRRGIFTILDSGAKPTTCTWLIFENPNPWYQQAWENIKHRLEF
jgi:hypothetical protein